MDVPLVYRKRDREFGDRGCSRGRGGWSSPLRDRLLARRLDHGRWPRQRGVPCYAPRAQLPHKRRANEPLPATHMKERRVSCLDRTDFARTAQCVPTYAQLIELAQPAPFLDMRDSGAVQGWLSR
jgi:hypothetical protein